MDNGIERWSASNQKTPSASRTFLKRELEHNLPTGLCSSPPSFTSWSSAYAASCRQQFLPCRWLTPRCGICCSWSACPAPTITRVPTFIASGQIPCAWWASTGGSSWSRQITSWTHLANCIPVGGSNGFTPPLLFCEVCFLTRRE